MSIDEALSDIGLIHDLIHYRTFNRVLARGGVKLFKQRLRNAIKMAYNI